MAPYYRETHTTELPPSDLVAQLGLEELESPHYKATSGPLSTSYAYSEPREMTLARAWIESFKRLGYQTGTDLSAGGATGAFLNATTVNGVTKERSYSASAYYKPAQKRPNLHVLTGVVVEKILFDTSGPSAVATGVRLVRNNKTTLQTIDARKEVILAAGTFNSPKLLELSGIGGKDLLLSKGVDLIIDHPNVGENFHDHPMTGMSYEVADHTSTLDDLTRQEPQAVGTAMEAYQNSRTGPFSAGAVNSFAFTPVDEFQSADGKATLEKLLKDHEMEAPSIQYDMLRSVYSSADQSSGLYFVYSAQGNFGADSTTGMTEAADPANFITIVCEISYPLSRGSSHISSSSPTDPPKFDPGYLRNSLDVEILARQALFMEKIISAEPLAPLLKPGGKRLPSYGQFSDLDSAKEYLRHTTTSGWHPVGTCAMLPRDKGGVVDDRLVVYGTTNLRVVDASIMPLISRGNTQSTVYAVAEKAADLIKETQRLERGAD